MIDYKLQGPRSEERTRIRVVSALRENRFPQAIIIDGPLGIGKKKFAMEIMQALLCTDEEIRPCGKCFGCKTGKNPEVVEHWVIPLPAKEASAKTDSEVTGRSSSKTVEDYTKEYVTQIIENPYTIDYLAPGASISVEMIRSLTKRFSLKNEGVRCVIIAEAERMNLAAANAFLKTLEEVPPNTYFILTTISSNLLLETIRSRCLSIHLPVWTKDEIKTELKTIFDKDISENALGLSLGSPGRALFYEEHAEAFSELACFFIEKSWTKKYSELIFRIQNEILATGLLPDAYSANLFLDVLNFLLTDILCKQNGNSLRLPDTTPQLSEFLFEELSPETIHEALKTVQETIQIISSRMVSVKVAVESLAIKLFDGYR